MGLISLLGGAMSGLFSLIAAALGRKSLYSKIYIGIYIALTIVFISAVNSAMASAAASLPTGSLLSAGFSLLPSNSGTCISIISAARVAAYLFAYKAKLLDITVKS
jgi:hypothetical protein